MRNILYDAFLPIGFIGITFLSATLAVYRHSKTTGVSCHTQLGLLAVLFLVAAQIKK
jgi:hypothetical protein